MIAAGVFGDQGMNDVLLEYISCFMEGILAGGAEHIYLVGNLGTYGSIFSIT